MTRLVTAKLDDGIIVKFAELDITYGILSEINGLILNISRHIMNTNPIGRVISYYNPHVS